MKKLIKKIQHHLFQPFNNKKKVRSLQNYKSKDITQGSDYVAERAGTQGTASRASQLSLKSTDTCGLGEVGKKKKKKNETMEIYLNAQSKII